MSITQNFKKLLDTYPTDKFNQSLVKTIKERLISNSSLQFNTFDDLTRVIGSINLGTPEAPMETDLRGLPQSHQDFLAKLLNISKKQSKIREFQDHINSVRFTYGDPPISPQEKVYVDRLIKKLLANTAKLESIETAKVISFQRYVDNIIVPFVNAIRKRSGTGAELIRLTTEDGKNRAIISQAEKEIFTRGKTDQGYIGRPEDSLTLEVPQRPNFNPEGAAPVDEPPEQKNEVEQFLEENKPIGSFDKNDSRDISRPAALPAGKPDFTDQVAEGAPMFQSNFRSLTKVNQVLILDVFNGAAGTYPAEIKNFQVNLSESLIVNNEADVQLEFINFHAVQGGATLATRKSLEMYHGFLVEILELQKYFNCVSNLGDVAGRFYIPNDTFGFNDYNQEETVLAQGEINAEVGNTATTLVLKDTPDAPADADHFNGKYIKILTGNAEGMTRKITDYAANRTVTIASTFGVVVEADARYVITELPISDKKLLSMTLKLKNSFICTMRPERLKSFTVALYGIRQGTAVAESLYLSNLNSRLQLGLYIKER